MAVMLPDGLYAVVRDNADGSAGICAGIIIEGGRIVDCAPILRKRISYWLRSPYLRQVVSATRG